MSTTAAGCLATPAAKPAHERGTECSCGDTECRLRPAPPPPAPPRPPLCSPLCSPVLGMLCWWCCAPPAQHAEMRAQTRCWPTHAVAAHREEIEPQRLQHTAQQARHPPASCVTQSRSIASSEEMELSFSSIASATSTPNSGEAASGAPPTAAAARATQERRMQASWRSSMAPSPRGRYTESSRRPTWQGGGGGEMEGQVGRSADRESRGGPAARRCTHTRSTQQPAGVASRQNSHRGPRQRAGQRRDKAEDGNGLEAARDEGQHQRQPKPPRPLHQAGSKQYLRVEGGQAARGGDRRCHYTAAVEGAAGAGGDR